MAYKATKANGDDCLHSAGRHSECGIRGYGPMSILPGLMDTPMAVDTRARVSGKGRAEVSGRAGCARCLLRRKMGTAGRRKRRTVSGV